MQGEMGLGAFCDEDVCSTIHDNLLLFSSRPFIMVLKHIATHLALTGITHMELGLMVKWQQESGQNTFLTRCVSAGIPQFDH